ncbi:MAG: tetratricopeptide repeat protein, partial [Acidobacteriota bacterium]|nr:tetratricopeptide repeat protein [Acidobacteriota bacterium]
MAAAVVTLSAFAGAAAAASSTPAEIHDLTEAGRNAEAAEAARALLVDAERRNGRRSAEVAEALELLSRALARAHPRDIEGKEERLALAERALYIRLELGESGPTVAWAYYVVGLVHNLGGDPASAVEPFERALTIAEEHYGRFQPETEIYVRDYGTALFGIGRYREAREVFERHLQISRRKFEAGDR